MDESKLEEYRHAVAELQESAKGLRTTVDWESAQVNYLKAKERCEKAKTALIQPTSRKLLQAARQGYKRQDLVRPKRGGD